MDLHRRIAALVRGHQQGRITDRELADELVVHIWMHGIPAVFALVHAVNTVGALFGTAPCGSAN